MKILIHFDFDEEQLQAFRAVASRCGDHEIIHARADEDPSDQSEDVEVILGQFKPAVCAAARRLRWIQSHSTGMDKFLFPEIVERDDVAMSNMSGKYAPQGAEHAWGLLLALSRGILSSIRRMEQGSWGGATPAHNPHGSDPGYHRDGRIRNGDGEEGGWIRHDHHRHRSGPNGETAGSFRAEAGDTGQPP